MVKRCYAQLPEQKVEAFIVILPNVLVIRQSIVANNAAIVSKFESWRVLERAHCYFHETSALESSVIPWSFLADNKMAEFDAKIFYKRDKDNLSGKRTSSGSDKNADDSELSVRRSRRLATSKRNCYAGTHYNPTIVQCASYPLLVLGLWLLDIRI